MKGRSHRFSSWFVRCTCVLLATAWLAGCGESGSNPPELPEIRFEIMPLLGGTVRFEIVEVRAGGVVFRSLAGQAIQAVAAVNVFVENAAAPFSIMVRLLESNPVLVRYRLTGSSGPGSAVVDAVGVPVVVGAPDLPGVPARPEARVDVCAPASGSTECTVFDGNGTFGVALSGSLGDTEVTRLLGRPSTEEPEAATPAIFFFAQPRDTVAAIVRAADSRFLRARLWLDGRLVAEDSGTGNAVVRADL